MLSFPISGMFIILSSFRGYYEKLVLFFDHFLKRNDFTEMFWCRHFKYHFFLEYSTTRIHFQLIRKEIREKNIESKEKKNIVTLMLDGMSSLEYVQPSLDSGSKQISPISVPNRIAFGL